MKGIIAAGHAATADAARIVLEQGGNAFDAALAAMLAACVAEPVLASLGGGGFLMARPAGDNVRLYDFFAHTPVSRKAAEQIDLQAVHADFGTVTQEFHIGQGSSAVPGMVAGWFDIHQDLGSIPLADIAAPAIQLARDGLTINRFQAYLFEVVAPIYRHTSGALQLFASAGAAGKLLQPGDHYRLRELGDLLEALVHEGRDLFYRGEIAALIERQGQTSGGSLSRSDLERYRVERRQPLMLQRGRDLQIHLNPAPSSGGQLVRLGLDILWQLQQSGLSASPMQMANVLAAVDQARQDVADKPPNSPLSVLLDSRQVQHYRDLAARHSPVQRGTTHLSIIDAEHNVASLTVSNGEGCGHVLPGCGFMLNNMLGEADLNPRGLHQWSPDRRLSSMMCPSILIRGNGEMTATGSGGSNRIRSALTQVIHQLAMPAVSVHAAVQHPRLHVEDGLLSIEAGFDERVVEQLCGQFAHHQLWPEPNLFFGGAHSVRYNPASDEQEGAGDLRRSGVSVLV